MISFKNSGLKGNLIAKKNQKILLSTNRFEKRGLEGRLIEALWVVLPGLGKLTCILAAKGMTATFRGACAPNQNSSRSGDVAAR